MKTIAWDFSALILVVVEGLSWSAPVHAEEVPVYEVPCCHDCDDECDERCDDSGDADEGDDIISRARYLSPLPSIGSIIGESIE